MRRANCLKTSLLPCMGLTTVKPSRKSRPGIVGYLPSSWSGSLSFSASLSTTYRNPFLLGSSKASFSWRQTGVRTADLNSFELRAGEWIGAYRELSGATGQRLRTILPRVGLTYQSSYEDAIRAGEDVALEFDLGDVPARRLAETMERELGILVLMVEAIQGVSGAACRLPELNVVLINRHESEVRRHFDLAHELFHILTWDTMPPERVECAEPGEAKIAPATARERRLARIEQLANNFAAGVLMPGPALDKLGAPHGDLVVWLDAAAAILGVSGPALKYRLLNAGRIAAEAKRIPDSALIQVARERQLPPPPVPFGELFENNRQSDRGRALVRAASRGIVRHDYRRSRRLV